MSSLFARPRTDSPACEARLLEAVVAAFNDEFAALNTRLEGGAPEPLYRPAEGGGAALIAFRADYLRSALHEVAHWCVAGTGRRCLPDYGYWYSPDDRDAVQQAAFFAVEARPQAVERHFCRALGVSFAPSIDNPGLQVSDLQLRDFIARLDVASRHYGDRGWPPRAASFAHRLRTIAH